MLKIKDNIDLKELEKFGFNKTVNRYFYFMKHDNIRDAFMGFIEVNRYTKELNIGYTRDWEDVDPEYIAYEIQDKVFDLIQAGYVEKVGE